MAEGKRAPKVLRRGHVIGFLDDSSFIDPPGIKVVQSADLGMKSGREMILASDPTYSQDSFPTMIMIPATRPSLRFPLTEALAVKHNIDLWYFDPAKWPDRVPIDVSEYLGIPIKE